MECAFLAALRLSIGSGWPGAAGWRPRSSGIADVKQDTSGTPMSHPAALSTGRFVWHEILTPDLPRSVKFYSSLFAWKIIEAKPSPVPGNAPGSN